MRRPLWLSAIHHGCGRMLLAGKFLGLPRGAVFTKPHALMLHRTFAMKGFSMKSISGVVPRFVATALVPIVLGVFTGSAFATGVSSNWHNYGIVQTPSPYGKKEMWLAAAVDDECDWGCVDNSGWIEAKNPGGGLTNLPAGWMGVSFDGFVDGIWCGTSGWSFSTTSNSYYYKYASLCNDPVGKQKFSTVVGGCFYVSSGGNYGQYECRGVESSPTLTH